MSLCYRKKSFTLENNVLSFQFTPTVPHIIYNEEGEPFLFALISEQEDDTYLYCEAPVSLQKGSDMDSAMLQMGIHKETGQVILLGAYDVEASDNPAYWFGKNQLALDTYDSMMIVQLSYDPLYNENGIVLPWGKWKDNALSSYVDIVMKDAELYIEMLPYETMRENIYGQIVVEDIYGNKHASELLLLHEGQQSVQEQNTMVLFHSIWEDPIKRHTLVDDDMLKLELTSIERDGYGRLYCRFVCSNKTDQTIRLSNLIAATDGLQRRISFYESISPHTTLEFSSLLDEI